VNGSERLNGNGKWKGLGLNFLRNQSDLYLRHNVWGKRCWFWLRLEKRVYFPPSIWSNPFKKEMLYEHVGLLLLIVLTWPTYIHSSQLIWYKLLYKLILISSPFCKGAIQPNKSISFVVVGVFDEKGNSFLLIREFCAGWHCIAVRIDLTKS